MDIKLTRVNTGVPYDIEFVNGQLQTVTGLQEIAQRYLFGLSVYLGELYIDPSFGVDYFNNVFGRSVTDTVVIDELKAAMIDTRGNEKLESFSLTSVSGTRIANLTAQVKTTQGEVNLTTEINI